MSNSAEPHLALFPCSGMGHLIPFLRLAADLHSLGAAITIITARPTVSTAESDYLSDFFATFPRAKRLEFEILPHTKSHLTNTDPFFIQMERVASSVHLLPPLLSSLSPPPSAAVIDFPILSRVLPLLSLPVYTLIITSARFFSIMASLSRLPPPTNAQIEIPNLGPIPVSSLPPPMLDPNHFFSANIIENAAVLKDTEGVMINTFTSLEPEAVEALHANGVKHLLPVGPLLPFEFLRSKPVINELPWLDEQAEGSVVYISFGSRTALSKEQMREVGGALEESGCKFIWVVKGGKVDKEDNEEVEEMVGGEFLKKTEGQGRVVKGWVEQERILAHRAIGGFVSHGGWNSVTEAATLGVPMMAWSTNGDQPVNAEVVQLSGLGVYDREWGGGRLVGREEIASKLRALIGDENLRVTVKEVKEKARRAREECLLQGLLLN